MSDTPQVVTVRVPLAIRRHGGRKVVLTPQGATLPPAPRARVDPALANALARAHCWNRLLDDGRHVSISETEV